ncbi:MAG: hypothetical protein B6244_00830 [Candidatus Cloacimonetes bacterium 4572_55]|nr:MAG: hypothetical protein B6244_00830 [Candidatus Cloacimonetes bacterium 4572_55]
MRKYVVVGAILIAFSAVSLVSWAGPPRGERNQSRPGHGDFGKGRSQCQGPELGFLERFGDEIGITEQQEEELKSIRFAAEKEIIQLKADAEVAKMDLRQLMDEDRPNEDAIYRQVDVIAELNAKIHKKRVGNRLAIKRILTDEQEAKLKEIRGDARAERGPSPQRRFSK